MDDFISVAVVLVLIIIVYGFAALVAAGMIALLILYWLMHATAWVHRRLGGRDWRHEDDGYCKPCE